MSMGFELAVSRRGLLGGGALALAGLSLEGFPLAWAKDTVAGPAAWPKLDALVKRYVAQKKVAGAIAAVGKKGDGPTALAAGTIGLGNPRTADMDTLWRAYSMTKPLTGMAAMLLVEDGKITLDQPLADFFPAFANMTVLKVPDGPTLEAVPAKTQITLRHLITHTAGLGYTIITKGALLKAYQDQGIQPAALSRMKIPGISLGAPCAAPDEFMERLSQLPLIAEPGTKWSYSIGLDVAGLLIAKIAGKPFEEFLAERIFGPLGMTSSYFQVPQSEVARLADNYFVVNGALIPIDPAASSIYLDKPAFAFGGAGLVCSARDYDRFLDMLLNLGELEGKRVMQEETAKLGMSNLLPAGIDMAGTFAAGDGFGAGGRVGLGERAGSYGWAGAAGTVAGVDTQHGFRVSGFTQYMPAEAYRFQREIFEVAYADMLGAAVK